MGGAGIVAEGKLGSREWLLTRRRLLKAGVGVAGAGLTALFFGSGTPELRAQGSGDLIEEVQRGQLPFFVRGRGAKAEEAYRFAAANREILQYIPCFCGCVEIGHRSNSDCYIAAVRPNGRIAYTSHAVG
ncbi:MAG: hypothetical protein HYV08_12395 [Deltaproteobacteria bacterium]|nr:hypothetical protein [Deltaproteobacteria bacterium]MBI3076205.1 hypothetical protein [Deltaproteobacteria bacterium]